jgi:hypothetical protein
LEGYDPIKRRGSSLQWLLLSQTLKYGLQLSGWYGMTWYDITKNDMIYGMVWHDMLDIALHDMI